MLLALVFALTACTDTIPRQDEAVNLVWDFFGGHRKPPAVSWKSGAALDCGRFAKGFYRARTALEVAVNAPRQCVLGVFWQNEYVAQVARPADFTFGNSALAHELRHAYVYDMTGDGDPNHDDPGFRDGGAVDQADALLNTWIP